KREVSCRQLPAAIRMDEEYYAVAPEAAGFLTAKSRGLETLLGPPRFPDAQILPRHADIAAALQAATNAAVMGRVRRLQRKRPLVSPCLARRLALNSVATSPLPQTPPLSPR